MSSTCQRCECLLKGRDRRQDALDEIDRLVEAITEALEFEGAVAVEKVGTYFDGIKELAIANYDDAELQEMSQQ